MQASKLLVLTISLGSLLAGCGGGGGSEPAPLVKILFVGNSYTFARVAPAMQYNAANVKDLTAPFNAIDPAGTNSFPVGSGIAPTPAPPLARAVSNPITGAACPVSSSD